MMTARLQSWFGRFSIGSTRCSSAEVSPTRMGLDPGKRVENGGPAWMTLDLDLIEFGCHPCRIWQVFSSCPSVDSSWMAPCAS